MTRTVNIAAYKFTALPELRALRARLLALCRGWELKGTILLSVEGINLFVSGAPAADCVSPRYLSSEIHGKNVHVTFAPPELALTTRDQQEPHGVTIAGADRRFVPAKARIDGAALVVWSDEVPAPVAVRYAWADNPSCNVVNFAGLPVSPFRTDDWPEVTTGKK